MSGSAGPLPPHLPPHLGREMKFQEWDRIGSIFLPARFLGNLSCTAAALLLVQAAVTGMFLALSSSQRRRKTTTKKKRRRVRPTVPGGFSV